MTDCRSEAGFWRRAAAFGVDAAWLFCASGVIALLLSGQPWPSPGQASGPSGMLAVLVNQLLPVLVLVIGWGHYGTTPGKLLLELRVIDARTGARPGYVRAAIRYVGYIVSTLTLGIGFLWIAFDRKREGLHDKLAGTRVIRVTADEELLAIDPASMT